VLQRKCAACSEEEEPVLARRAASSSLVSASVTAAYDTARGGGGRPLDPATRGYFESRYRTPFDRVRVHTGARADAAARSIDSVAYTVGREIVFRDGAYAPDSDAGRRLLGHELAHVVQQGGTVDAGPARSVSASAVSRPDDPLEREADRAAEVALTGGAVTLGARADAASPRIDRQSGQQTAGGPAPVDVPSFPVLWFKLDSTELRQDAEVDSATHLAGAIATTRAFLARSGIKPRVIIHGYASTEGSEAHNETLSDARAKRVKELLVEGGIPASALVAIGHGKDSRMPGRAWNRRVEIELTTFTAEAVGCDKPKRATGVSDFIHLIACAEKEAPLIGPRGMLSLLRQIYYGPSWSLNPNVQWQKIIPCGIPMPDPSTLFSRPLLTALRDSKEVPGIDISHVFPGLEAMICPTETVTFSGPAGLGIGVSASNVSIATWIGDLGSAAAERAYDDQYSTPKPTNWNKYFLSSKSLAAEEDLIGDIDAYLIRRNLVGVRCGRSQKKPLTDINTPISQLLQDYYVDASTPYRSTVADRFRCFVEALGGTIGAGNKITKLGPGELGRTDELIESFAWVNYFKNVKDRQGAVALANDLANDDLLPVSDLSFDLADEFVHWLERKLSGP
jgi:outer membrane protein OmpA-like peptidoglycan-associated protein